MTAYNTTKKNQSDNNAAAPALHIPVLLEQVLYYLSPEAGESYLDLTAGYGGHARAILARSQNPQNTVLVDRDTVLVDRDSVAIAELEQEFARNGTAGTAIEVLHKDFYSASKAMQDADRQFDMILADLGVSSLHLDDADRGFAIASAGPLDMRMDQSQEGTAADIVNNYAADAIADILDKYGEEPKSRQIAKLIVQNRPFTTTVELAAVVARAWAGKSHSRTHPATRTFQALRIAVNDELRLLRDALPLWLDLLAPGGRLAVISFHSLEDRIVKRALAEAAGDYYRYDTDLRLLTKRPVVADQHELAINPRARSAKLRAVLKQKK